MEKIVLVTGATAGIGEATARIFAKNGYNLILTGRRKERLFSLKENLTSEFGTNIFEICFDVRNPDEVSEALEAIPSEWKNVDILVNNAGLAVGLGHIQDGLVDDWERMIDTNIKGLLYVTRTVSPWMVKRGNGHILNVGSIAGKEVYEYGNVYCATKHAVDALSKAMRIDMLKHGIKVTNIAPGMVETEFSLVRFKGDAEKAKVPYNGLEPLHGEDIADVIYYCSTLPAHVNINDVLIMPTAQASSTYITREG